MSPNQLWTLLEGKCIDGKESIKYHLQKLKGDGGYGGVFLADEVVDDELQRQVAVKLMDKNEDPNNIQELKIDLQHPHAVQCFASGQWTFENCQYLYLVMELAEKTLAQHLQIQQNRTLSEAETWDVVESLGSGLVYFSESSPKLVHRDLKPANVLRVGDSWKIADFGIVRFVEGDILTTKNPMATLPFAAPESYEGIVTPALDMWSLGVMIVEMLTGQLPFLAAPGRSLPVVVMEDEPKIVSPLPSPFPEIVKGCLEKDHEKRLTAEQLEVKFIIPRLVREEWKPETETQKAQTEEAVSIVIMSRPNLKKKTNAPNVWLRYILKWTKFQQPCLTQLLAWVCDAQDIPAEGKEEKWICQLVRSHIKDWNAQKLAGYLDFDALSNSVWLKLQQKYDNPFAIVDDFIARPNLADLGTIQKISNIIDDYSASISKKNTAEGKTTFQRLIVAALKSKFSHVKKKIDRLLREIKQWNAQELANCLEANAPANSFWLELQQKYDNPFAIVDDFLARPNLADEEKIKKIRKILDEYRAGTYNGDGSEGQTNFQRLILDSLNGKFSQAQKIMAMQSLDQLLTEVVHNAQGDLVAILIFDLTEGLPLYHNRQLQQSNPALYHALFGEGGDIGGEAIQGFNALNGIQDALNQFGETTQFGDLSYSVFKLKIGTMIVSFLEIGIPLAICFIAPEGKNLGTVLLRYNMKIQQIKDAVKAILSSD